MRIHQARNGRFHCIIFDIAQGSAFLAWKVGNVKRQRNKDILPKKLKPECGASSQRCNANKGNRETIVFCLLLVSSLSLQILRVTSSCHNTMDCNRTPTLRGTENTPDLDTASRDYSGSITYWFKCSLRGFHVYKEAWSPIVGEQLKCCYERINCYDRYANAATKRLRGRLADSAVGHLPEEISRVTRFFSTQTSDCLW